MCKEKEKEKKKKKKKKDKPNIAKAKKKTNTLFREENTLFLYSKIPAQIKIEYPISPLYE
jgi:hypothetical protein